MKNLILYAHPYDESYCAAILENLIREFEKQNQTYDLIDLYKEKFNPVLEKHELALYSQGKFVDPKVQEYQNRFKDVDHLWIIFPVWWYDLPAILKGFFDKVFLKHWAYDVAPSGIPIGKLGFIKKTTVISTMKSPAWYYWLVYRNSLKQSLIKGTLKFCGLSNIQWINITNIENMGELKRKKRLTKLRRFILPE